MVNEDDFSLFFSLHKNTHRMGGGYTFIPISSALHWSANTKYQSFMLSFEPNVEDNKFENSNSMAIDQSID